jgi:hypothetical protein
MALSARRYIDWRARKELRGTDFQRINSIEKGDGWKGDISRFKAIDKLIVRVIPVLWF